MLTTHAAKIIKKAIAQRDAEAAKEGLNATRWTLRRIGSKLTERIEDLADDVIAGHAICEDEVIDLRLIAEEEIKTGKYTIEICGAETELEARSMLVAHGRPSDMELFDYTYGYGKGNSYVFLLP